VDERTCPHCGETKPLDDFQVNRTNGYRYRNDPDYRRLKKSRSLAAYRKRTA
jgi:glutaredoxin